MISIRKYLEMKLPSCGEAGPSDEESFTASLAQLAAVALAEFGTLSHQGAKDATERFLAGVRRTKTLLEEAESPGDIRALCEDLPSVVAEFRRAGHEQEERQTADVQKMVAMLRQTIEALSDGNSRAVSRLRAVESEIQAASQISEITALRGRLRTCVEQIRVSAAAQQAEFAATKARLERDFMVMQENVALARGGIPGRSQAEERMAEALGTARILAVVLDRQHAIKGRFGAAVGEKYVAVFASEVTSRLPAEWKMFRWNERCLVVEAEGAREGEEALAELRRRLSGFPRAVQVDVGGRVALLENAHRCRLIDPSAGPNEIARQIEELSAV